MVQKIFILAILSMLLVTTTELGFAAPYYRFWRGWKVSRIEGKSFSYHDFNRALNEVFIPATIHSSAGKGLIAYLPSLPFKPKKLEELRKQGIDLPDEVALVVYESEAAYLALRETPEGKAYQDLHFVYFDMNKDHVRSKSKSSVPQLYQGALQIEQSYDMLGSQESWKTVTEQNRKVQFQLHVKKPQATAAEYLDVLNRYASEMKKQAAAIGLVSHTILISEKYWIEYQLWENARSAVPASAQKIADLLKPIEMEFQHTRCQDLLIGVPGKNKLQFGHTAVVQF